MARIGLIQTKGIGDIIIALPISDFLIEQGHEVWWPVDAAFISYLKQAKPEINFLPVKPGPGYFVERPRELLKEARCDVAIPLYSYLEGARMVNEVLAECLRFDEYKYAVAEVPFYRKWRLRFNRSVNREMALHHSLGVTGEYICVHTVGSEMSVTFQVPDEWRRRYQIIEVRPLTDNPFDWTYTLEHASKLVLLDSCFSNLIEQLNWMGEKYLILRSEIHDMPTLINGWKYLAGMRAPRRACKD